MGSNVDGERGTTTVFVLFMYNSCLAIFLTYGVFFTRITNELHVTSFWTSFVFAVFAILYSLSSLGMGLLLDSYGASRTIFIGGMLMSSGLILSTFAPSIFVLVLTYGIIAGAGTGSMWLPTSFSVFEKFDISRARELTGIVSAGTAFGSLFYAPLEAFVISVSGWRVAFSVLGILVFVLTIGASIVSKRSGGIGRDNAMIRKNNLEEKPVRSRQVELARAFRTVRKSSGFWSLYVYYMMGNAFSRTMVVLFLVPMLEARGLSVFIGSIALALIGGGSMVGRLFTRIRRISEEQIAAFSFIIQGLSSFALFYSGNVILIYFVSFIFGIGYGGYIPQFALIVRKRYGLALYGGIFGILLTSFGVGAFSGPVVGAIAHSITGSYAVIFYLASAWSIVIGLHQMISFGRSRVDPPDN
jgi:OFA family oxalate/formate antiporter-like MFS transporter